MISAVSYGVFLAYCCCQCAGHGKDIAPGTVGIFYFDSARSVKNSALHAVDALKEKPGTKCDFVPGI